ncbi:hypothetical protein [Rhodococcus spongiicola]|uniref:Uncharacterized protein n=1 Tax=Rhodococcus spongiicola TaxID=2487352 RepID=A0A3S3E5H1_9NOCA|nr:hypothetical protein [Rhodococcus spongiicola]RVW06205.1 hypothetical protein EF834_01750 [Rhodococcus spongiicola]
MIKSVRATAAAALAAPLLAAVFAAPANAAPEDVTLTAEFQGSDVEVRITNNSSQEIVCLWQVANDDPSAPGPFVSRDHLIDRGGEYRSTATFDDGSYELSWSCLGTTRPVGEWGTGNLSPTETAEPIQFTTPASTDGGGTDDGGITGDGWHLLPDWVKLVFAAINTGSGVLNTGSGVLGSS